MAYSKFTSVLDYTPYKMEPGDNSEDNCFIWKQTSRQNKQNKITKNVVYTNFSDFRGLINIFQESLALESARRQFQDLSAFARPIQTMWLTKIT